LRQADRRSAFARAFRAPVAPAQVEQVERAVILEAEGTAL
jgi:hypothetical protein